ncbi:MAG: DUF420 domain-containing protein [Chitinophagales bacterium]|nr:DUF420 domain-containing protein [Chitinophagales bacterium]
MSKYPPSNEALGKKLTLVSYALTAIAFLSVGLMRRVKIDTTIDFSFIPPLNALINTSVFVCLLVAFYFIRKGEYLQHRKFMVTAIVLSGLFFVGYILYHFTTTETAYCGDGIMKTIYYIILFSHIVLAGLSLPFILITFVRGYTYQIAQHKKIARWVYPIWLYVALTGPITYLFLKPCYL